MVEDLGARGEDGAQCLLLDAEEVGRQHFDGRLGQLLLQRADRRRVVARAAVGDVVAVDRGDDHVLEVHLRRGLREPQRLQRVGWVLGLAGMDVAVAAGARAGVAKDLERGRATPPALGDVRATGLLADRVQRLSVDQLLDVEVARIRARRAHLHPFGPPRPLGYGKRLLHGPESSCGPDRGGSSRAK